MKLRYLIASLIVSGCASQGVREPQSQDKDVQQISQDSDTLVKQDLGMLTQSEIQERENLNALQMEAVGSTRSPAVESDTENTDAASETPKSEDLFNAEKYSVQKGDTLSGIAAAYYGHAKAWKKIAELNPSLTDPNKIEIGQVVYLPKENMQANAGAQLTPLADTSDTKSKSADAGMNRTPASAKYDDVDAAAADATAPAATAPAAMKVETGISKNLSRVIGFLGFTLFLAVFVSFALSKPKKPY